MRPARCVIGSRRSMTPETENAMAGQYSLPHGHPPLAVGENGKQRTRHRGVETALDVKQHTIQLQYEFFRRGASSKKNRPRAISRLERIRADRRSG